MSDHIRIAQLLILVDELQLAVDRQEIRVVRAQLGSPRPAIAVVGLLNRGKSTLVNRLVGCEVVATGSTPETARTIRVGTGDARSVRVLSDDGTWQRVDGEVADLVEFSRRSGAASAAPVEIRLPCRLPTSFDLIDSPGANEAAVVGTADQQRVSALVEEWKLTGAFAGVVTLAVPPTPGRADHELLAAAEGVFGGRVIVVLQAVDSSVSEDDLEEVAAEFRRRTGRELITLGPGDAGPKWGYGPLGELEKSLGRLASMADAARSAWSEDLSLLEERAARAVSAVSAEARANLVALRDRLPALADPVKEAMLQRCRDIDRQVAASKAQQAAAAETRLRFLDDQARDLARRLPRRRSEFNAKAHAPIVRELLELGGEGSNEAFRALAGPLGGEESTRTPLGLGLTKVLAAFPRSRWLEVIPKMSLSGKEVAELVRTVDSTEGVTAARPAVLGQVSACTSAADLARIVKHSPDPDFRAAARAQRAEVLLAEYERSVGAWHQLDDQSFRNIKRLDASLPAADEFATRSRGHERLRHAREASSRRALEHAEGIQSQIVSTAVVDVGVTDSQRELALDVALWARDADPVRGDGLIERYAISGPVWRWIRQSRAAVDTAVARLNSIDSLMKTVYVLSFVGWAFSILALPGDPGTAVAIWLISFMAWLGAKHYRQTEQHWWKFYRPPPID